jgi:hypothetical protein
MSVSPNSCLVAHMADEDGIEQGVTVPVSLHPHTAHAEALVLQGALIREPAVQGTALSGALQTPHPASVTQVEDGTTAPL